MKPSHLPTDPVLVHLEHREEGEDERSLVGAVEDATLDRLKRRALRVAPSELEEEFPSRGGLRSLAHQLVEEDGLPVHERQRTREISGGHGAPELVHRAKGGGFRPLRGGFRLDLHGSGIGHLLGGLGAGSPLEGAPGPQESQEQETRPSPAPGQARAVPRRTGRSHLVDGTPFRVRPPALHGLRRR